MRDLMNILAESENPAEPSVADRLIAAAENAIHALLDTGFSSDAEVASALRDAISDFG